MPSHDAAMSVAQPADRPEFLERHFTVGELAEAWGLVEETVRPWFLDQPGVLKIEHRMRKGKRGYISLRIPESTARKIYREKTGQKA
jgi:hypothetical protein